MAHVVVVGAGVSGLSLAYRLRRSMPEASITVLEEADRPGGTTWTLREDGFVLEMGPNGFLDSKPTTKTLKMKTEGWRTELSSQFFRSMSFCR